LKQIQVIDLKAKARGPTMEEIEQRMEFEHMAGGGKRTLLATKKG
jgi:hypothetical protein